MMKNLFKTTANSLDEILFENRNKAYGAYVLRQESDVALTKAMVLGITSVVAVATIPFVINNFLQTQENTTTVIGQTHEIYNPLITSNLYFYHFLLK